jgi:hypothetical protein
MLISHDVLRIEPIEPDWGGWIYAYLRSPTVRAIMKSAQYGHIIKHLEVSHLDALPIANAPASDRKRCADFVQQIRAQRDEAHRLALEAERLYEAAFGLFAVDDIGERGFSARANQLFMTGRRRLDAWHHNPSVAAIQKHLSARATAWESLVDLGFKVWLPTRFRRIPAEDGVLLIDSSDFFEINPDCPEATSKAQPRALLKYGQYCRSRRCVQPARRR